MSASPPSYLIVGAGVFGASTALRLIQKNPSAIITLADRTIPCRAGASWDWSKVVRADYANIMYMKLAREAMAIWRSDSVYKPFYHESGLIWVDGKGFVQNVIKNYAQLEAREKVRVIKAEEVGELYGGMFANAKCNDMTEVLLNESSGWAEASKVLESVIETAIAGGVKCVKADITTLLFDDEKDCIGVKTADGRMLYAEQIILATGAGTSKLIADSAPGWKDLQVGNRLTAAALFTGMAKLSDAQAGRYKEGPVFLQAGGQNQGTFLL